MERTRLAEDAAGRVELIVLHAPADVLEPTAEPPLPRVESRLAPSLMRWEGWLAVGLVAAVLAVVFVIGLWFTR